LGFEERRGGQILWFFHKKIGKCFLEFYFPSVHLTVFAIKKKSPIFQYCKIEKNLWYKQIPEK
jgi:hypothetical protein